MDPSGYRSDGYIYGPDGAPLPPIPPNDPPPAN